MLLQGLPLARIAKEQHGDVAGAFIRLQAVVQFKGYRHRLAHTEDNQVGRVGPGYCGGGRGWGYSYCAVVGSVRDNLFYLIPEIGVLLDNEDQPVFVAYRKGLRLLLVARDLHFLYSLHCYALLAPSLWSQPVCVTPGTRPR